jgi:hypothetical protein
MREQPSECEAMPFLWEVEAGQCMKQKDIANDSPTYKSQSQYGVVPFMRVTMDITGTSPQSVLCLARTLPGGCSRWVALRRELCVRMPQIQELQNVRIAEISHRHSLRGITVNAYHQQWIYGQQLGTVEGSVLLGCYVYIKKHAWTCKGVCNNRALRNQTRGVKWLIGTNCEYSWSLLHKRK